MSAIFGHDKWHFTFSSCYFFCVNSLPFYSAFILECDIDVSGLAYKLQDL